MDVVLALAGGGVGGLLFVMRVGVLPVWAGVVGAVVVVSFLNHVPLAWAARGSVGKLLTGLRVARIGVADDRRPSPLQLAGRWLAGLYWMAALLPLHAATDSDIEGLDTAGVRVVPGSRAFALSDPRRGTAG